MMAEEKKKYCPLAYAVGKGAYDQEVSSFDYCTKEQCALWFASEGRCSKLVATEFLGHIVKYLSNISDHLKWIGEKPQ